MSVHIKYEVDISNCRECPFKASVTEQGFFADVCNLLSGYEAAIPNKGIHRLCPFRKKNQKKIRRM